MDIETNLSLRSIIRTNVSPIHITLIGALLLHSLLWMDWSERYNSNIAELPEWINIKLVAGFENTENKVQQIETKKQNISKTIKPTKNNSSTEVKKDESKSSLTSPTTFIAADSRPYLLENEKPVYPATARRRGMFGVVILSVAVSKKGYVEKISIRKTSGFKILDRSALSSVKGWRFIPAKKGEENVASLMEIPIRFVLNDV